MLTTINESPNNSQTDSDASTKTIQIQRWIVYFQAALLGVVATTFFVFGMMVGSMTTQTNSAIENDLVSISGRVITDAAVPDAGAVILLLPDPPSEFKRQDPTLVHPSSFEPLENPTIDWIRQQGGTVVRANIDGVFEVFCKPGTYNFLVISKSETSGQSAKLSKKQVASISQYFLPVEKLIDRQRFYWKTLSIEDNVVMNEINFD